MTLLLVAHAVVAVVVLTLCRDRPKVAAGLGVALLATTTVVVGLLGIGADTARVERYAWIDELGLLLSFRLDGFAVLMALLVAGLGAVVLWYSVGYFSDDESYVRFVGLFVAFAGSMTGLVLSDDLFTMFVFWEMTSICSFLLIGLNDRSATARSSALRALLVTSAGGLSLLGGVALFQVAVGTSSFAELATLRPDGTIITVAAVLCLVGAFTKSAQFPFHFWLPGAMAAPTPVSAYLHSATMVKAGIVLIARLAPIVGADDVWRWMVVLAGGTTMIIGGYRALRQTDAKLLLAHSTVSQLGFLTILMGLGVPGTTYAGVVHLVAHAIFKAGLFLSVGVVDHATGTRDIRRLSGVGRQLPWLAGLTIVGAASMAGLMPLFGFATKERALVALLDGDVDGGAGAVVTVALIAVIAGSILSAAYSVRLVHGLFGTKRHRRDDMAHVHHAPGADLMRPVALVSVASLAGGLVAGTVGGWLDAPARALDALAVGYLELWPGINEALLISVAVVVTGAVVGRLVPLDPRGPRMALSGERVYQSMLDGLLEGSRSLTAVTQSGSLIAYLGVIMSVVAVVLGVGILVSPADDVSLVDLVWADSWVQAAVVVLAILFSVAIVLVRERFVSAVLLGGIGFSCAVIFALHGSPDLALTQILIETLTIVVFLLVLRQMPRRFDAAPTWTPRIVRVVIASTVGVCFALFAAMANGARTAPSAGEVHRELALPEAGGRNVVNVILVDFRGMDTLGEITVLATAALGVANLVRMARRAARPADVVTTDPDPIEPTDPEQGSTAGTPGRVLPGTGSSAGSPTSGEAQA